MARRRPTRKQLEEKLKFLNQLINDNKVSEEKRMELQVEYCFLQRELDLLNHKTTNKTTTR